MPPETPTEDARPATLAPRLLETLGALEHQLSSLVELAEEKLAAMRAADTTRLNACACQEAAALEGLFALDQQRAAILARLAQTLPDERVTERRLSEIAHVFDEPARGKLLEKTRVLRDLGERLRKKNQLAATVARHLHKHIRAVFADVAKASQESAGYGPDGRGKQQTRETWVNAIG